MMEEPQVGSEDAESLDEASEKVIRPAGLQAEEGTLEDLVVKAMETCFDPEIRVNIYEL